MSVLFDVINALIPSRTPLPPPEERKRLRKAHGLTVDEVAKALRVRRATVSGWESGKTDPRPPERDAYARLLGKLAELYPTEPPGPSESLETSGAEAAAPSGTTVGVPPQEPSAGGASASAPSAPAPQASPGPQPGRETGSSAARTARSRPSAPASTPTEVRPAQVLSLGDEGAEHDGARAAQAEAGQAVGGGRGDGEA
ncbi:helix-turn-helix transcriptional regulator, partial [Streptomyces werraensis]